MIAVHHNDVSLLQMRSQLAGRLSIPGNNEYVPCDFIEGHVKVPFDSGILIYAISWVFVLHVIELSLKVFRKFFFWNAGWHRAVLGGILTHR